MGNHKLTNRPAALASLLTALDDDAAQAVLVYGPRTVGKSLLVQAALQELKQTEKYIPILLNLRNNLDQSRVEIIHKLASNAVDESGLDRSLLDNLTPNRFHNEFLAQFFAALPLSRTLLFVFDDIDLQDRAQLSKLNNLLLPLLRRLAPLERLKFVIVVDDVNTEKLQALISPIFAVTQKIELRWLSQPAASASQQEEYKPERASDETQEKADAPRRTTLLLLVFILVILTLLINVYLLVSILNPVQ